MKDLLKTRLGQFRIVAFLEGISYLSLFFVTMPLKYLFDSPAWNKPVGYAHGFLFILYLIYTFIISKKYNWSHTKTTWKVLLASLIPFGTFYIDKTILSKY